MIEQTPLKKTFHSPSKISTRILSTPDASVASKAYRAHYIISDTVYKCITLPTVNQQNFTSKNIPLSIFSSVAMYGALFTEITFKAAFCWSTRRIRLTNLNPIYHCPVNFHGRNPLISFGLHVFWNFAQIPYWIQPEKIHWTMANATAHLSQILFVGCMQHHNSRCHCNF